MNNSSINTLLMDMGNVMFEIEPSNMDEYLLKAGIHVTPEKKQRFLQLADKYELGEINTAPFLLQGSEITETDNIDTIKHAWNSIIPHHHSIDSTQKACRIAHRLGVRLVLFSNTNELHIKLVREIYSDLLPLFDDLILSYEVHGMKPHPPMYRYAIEELGILPERTLYFDDKPENIEAGRSFGFRSHIFDHTQPETFFSQLPESWLI